jgi:hypothetical protein
MLSSPAFAQCIPEPAKLTFGEKASDDWVKQCEQQFRNPLPLCHKLYSLPSDRELCLGVIVKLDAYDRGKHKVHEDAVKAEKAKAKQ